MTQEAIKFKAQVTAPNPLEVTYWIDLTASPDGQIIKCYTDNKWQEINTGNGGGSDVDLSQITSDINTLKTSKVDVTTYERFVSESATAHNNLSSAKADKATTLSDYGITDAYTIAQANNTIDAKVADLVNSAPETLNTLGELSAALGNDPNFATTIATQIGSKANSADVYTKEDCNSAISTAINAANKVGSVAVTSMEVVTAAPSIPETGVLYLVTEE